MTAFGWKRKANEKLNRSSEIKSVFNEDDSSDDDGTTYVRKKTKKLPTDKNCPIKSAELKEEGVRLAERGLFMKALSKWDQALQMNPTDAKLLEMTAQAYLQMDNPVLALQNARKAVMCDPCWWIAYQTLGRAQLHVGDIKLAVISFCKALHINPENRELWEEDLNLACHLLNEEQKLSASVEPSGD